MAGWDSLKRCPEDEAVKMKPKSQVILAMPVSLDVC